MINIDELGQKLKNERKKRGITQDDIADHLNLTKFHISDIERGKHKVSVNILLGYCEMLHVTPNDLLEISDEENNILPELFTLLSYMNVDEQKRILKVVIALQ